MSTLALKTAAQKTKEVASAQAKGKMKEKGTALSQGKRKVM